jgi:predicted RNase H-like HicB family nuclease
MADLEYPIVVQKLCEGDGGGYIAFVPDLKGCVGDGSTPEEAVTDARSAIKEWIDEAVRLGRVVPPPNSAVRKIVKERQDLQSLVKAQDSLLRSQTDRRRRCRKRRPRLTKSKSDWQSWNVCKMATRKKRTVGRVRSLYCHPISSK